MLTQAFYDYMIERENIRLRRAAGAPKPWTDDPILQQYKFTNVKRAHDKTSRLLNQEFYRDHQDDRPEVILFNCAMARYWGTIEMMRAVGWQSDFRPRHLKDVANRRMKAGERVFTGAYVITNASLPGSKIGIVVDVFLKSVWEQAPGIVPWRTCGSWRLFVETLSKADGFGGTSFMSKEATLDTFYFRHFWDPYPKDKNDWTPIGPGSMRGAARVTQSEKDKLGPGPTLEICKALFAERFKYWPDNWVELELTDIQFCLCEFQKYERTRLGQGRPRSRFDGV